MMLLVDIGNSRMKWTTVEEGRWGVPGLKEYHADTLAQTLDKAFSRKPRPEQVLVASVAGEAVRAEFSRWIAARWSLTPEFLQASAEACGVRNAYTEPERLGVDRWAALIAAHTLFPGGACIVDCGTAVTFDALAPDGSHMGGLIMPGLSLMRRSLADNTDAIGETGKGEVSLLARNTADGVAAGTLYALVAAVDRISGDVADALQGPVRRIITGGDAKTVLALLGGRWQHEPMLVLKGLEVVADQALGSVDQTP